MQVVIPGSGRSPGGRHGNPLQYSCLGNPMDRGAWQATVHRVTQSQTQLKQISTAWHNGSVSISLNLLLPALQQIFLSSNLKIHLHIYILSYICHDLKLFWGIISFITQKRQYLPPKAMLKPNPSLSIQGWQWKATLLEVWGTSAGPEDSRFSKASIQICLSYVSGS